MHWMTLLKQAVIEKISIKYATYTIQNEHDNRQKIVYKTFPEYLPCNSLACYPQEYSPKPIVFYKVIYFVNGW